MKEANATTTADSGHSSLECNNLYTEIATKKVIQDHCHVTFGSHSEDAFKNQVIDSSRVSGNGRLLITTELAKVDFASGANTYQVRTRLIKPFIGNGLAFRIKLSNWKSIRYLAIGYTADNKFRHIKVANIAREEWVNVDFAHDDLCFGLQNDWASPDAYQINDVRLYISGQAFEDGASVEISECLIWRSAPDDFPLANLGTGLNTYKACLKSGDIGHVFSALNNGLLHAVDSYLKKCFRDVESQVMQFMRTGSSPLYGNVNLEWPVTEVLPAELGSVGTYRYSWHALHPAVMLMMRYRETGAVTYLFPARQLVENWLHKSFFHHDEDKKYAWYDHGTAERLLAMVMMWSIGIEHKFDHRFMARLLLVIHKHAALLGSEMFYASHQPTRYHNHAWFQDLALMATALAIPNFPCAVNWLETAKSRLTDQLKHLIVRDNGYAVFVENSIGYHQGVQRLIEFAGELVALTGEESLILDVARELPRFSEFLRYPDNRSPAQGDTFRRGNPYGLEIRRLKPYPAPECIILPKAGYGIVKGNHDGCRFMMTVFATSLCRTHKHEDNLSFTLFADGLEWLIDPSFYSHEYAAPIPAYLRSAVAHNALAIPDRRYSIEPGIATFDGHVNGSEFMMRGEHRAYENVVIRREVRGRIDCLELDIMDIAEAKIDAELGDLNLMLHCGEQVSATLNGHELLLSHPDSKFQVAIRLPSDECHLYYDQTDGDKIRGVTGLGFMQHAAINTVECRVPFNQPLNWRICLKTA